MRRLILLTLALLALGAGSATAAPPVPGIHTIAQRGFGDRANSYAWGMAWFKGHLYVGTGRNVLCTEGATTNFYFPFSDNYKLFPQPSVKCTRDPYALEQRAEIWRYTPRTGRWTQVYRSATVPNPRAPGRRIARDIAYRGMSVHRDRHGRQALFVSAVSPNEYVPELARTTPPRLLRTYDGQQFHDIGGQFIVHKTGQFGDHRPIGYRGMQWWRGELYVLVSTGLAGDGEVFRVDNPFGTHARFRQVTPPWMYAFELQVFNGELYVGIGSRRTGYSVWKTSSRGAPYRFRPIIRNGAGRGPVMTGVIGMNVFRGRLYVSAVSWYCDCSQLPTSEMVRIAKDGSWQVVVGRPRATGKGRTRAPISGLMDGFENIFVTHIWRMENAGGALYAGTLDWSYLLQTSKDWLKQNSGLLSSIMAGELGFDLWASCDGRDWFPVTRTAFTGDEYDFGVRNIVRGPRGIFVGTANHSFGTRIINDTQPACDPMTGPGSRDPGRPRQPTPGPSSTRPKTATRATRLLTDTQRDGTVVSWETTRPGASFQVQRAAYTTIPLSYRRPLALPSGFWADGQMPVLTTPDAPGSITTQIPVQLGFRAIATTRSAYYVDRTRRPGVRYAYRVVPQSGADGLAGGGGSNVQVVPDPRPPATWRALQQALGSTALRSSTGGAAPTAVTVARIARSAPSDDARDLAERLLRRMAYANVAGGPAGGG
jgi:hypothetical protein